MCYTGCYNEITSSLQKKHNILFFLFEGAGSLSRSRDSTTSWTIKGSVRDMGEEFCFFSEPSKLSLARSQTHLKLLLLVI